MFYKASELFSYHIMTSKNSTRQFLNNWKAFLHFLWRKSRNKIASTSILKLTGHWRIVSKLLKEPKKLSNTSSKNLFFKSEKNPIKQLGYLKLCLLIKGAASLKNIYLVAIVDVMVHYQKSWLVPRVNVWDFWKVSTSLCWSCHDWSSYGWRGSGCCSYCSDLFWGSASHFG